MKRTLLFAFTASLAASALSVPYSQPWTAPLPAWDSVVRSCNAPIPFPRRCADDFLSSSGTSNYTQIVWWGNVSSNAQIQRRYYIATYADNGAGQPNWAALTYQTCLIPNATFVGNDCTGQRVFRFTAILPTPMPAFSTIQWLSISEDDSASVTPGAIDFWWSVHEPVAFSPAVQYNGAVFTQPLFSPCNNTPDDFAFVLI